MNLMSANFNVRLTMKRSVCFFVKVLLVLVVVFISSCSGKHGSDNLGNKKDIVPVSCVVLLATQTPYKDTAADAVLRDELEKGVHFLDITVKDQLQKSAVTRIVEPSQIETDMGEVFGGKLGAIKKIAEKTKCGAVLMTTLSQFSQRQGGEFAVDEPAVAAFEMQLIEAASGRTLWSATFNETQTSLLSNLFSFDKARSRGFKWITVEELAAQGVHEKMIDCPYFF